ncbi:unnamed protein product [Camellia sinensis]
MGLFSRGFSPYFPLYSFSFQKIGIQRSNCMYDFSFEHLPNYILLVYFHCRKHLFNMINDLPTIFEVVTGTAKKQVKEKSSVSNHSNSKSKSNSKVPNQGNLTVEHTLCGHENLVSFLSRVLTTP